MTKFLLACVIAVAMPVGLAVVMIKLLPGAAGPISVGIMAGGIFANLPYKAYKNMRRTK